MHRKLFHRFLKLSDLVVLATEDLAEYQSPGAVTQFVDLSSSSKDTVVVEKASFACCPLTPTRVPMIWTLDTRVPTDRVIRILFYICARIVSR